MNKPLQHTNVSRLVLQVIDSPVIPVRSTAPRACLMAIDEIIGADQAPAMTIVESRPSVCRFSRLLALGKSEAREDGHSTCGLCETFRTVSGRHKMYALEAEITDLNLQTCIDRFQEISERKFARYRMW